jgi:hypothetical protein
VCLIRPAYLRPASDRTVYFKRVDKDDGRRKFKATIPHISDIQFRGGSPNPKKIDLNTKVAPFLNIFGNAERMRKLKVYTPPLGSKNDG